MEQMLGFHGLPTGKITLTFAFPIQSSSIVQVAICEQLLSSSSGFMPMDILPLGDMT